MVLFGQQVSAANTYCENVPHVRYEELKSLIASKVLSADLESIGLSVTNSMTLLPRDVVSESAFVEIIKEDIMRVNEFYLAEEERVRNDESALRLLKRYAAVQYVGCKKIAKKFDKNAHALGEVSNASHAVEKFLQDLHFTRALQDEDIFLELDVAHYRPASGGREVSLSSIPEKVALPTMESICEEDEEPTGSGRSALLKKKSVRKKQSTDNFRLALDFGSTYIAYGFVYSCRRALGVAKGAMSTTSLSPSNMSNLDGILLLSYVTMQFIVAKYGGILKRLVPPEQIIPIAVLCTAGATYATGRAAPNFIFMAIAWAINGVFQALVYPYVCVLLAKQMPASRRGRLMGVWNTCSATGGIISAALSAAALERRGYRGAFESAALVTSLCGTVLFAILSYTSGQNHDDDKIQQENRTMKHINVWEMQRVPIVCAAYSLIKPLRYTFLFWHNFYLTAVLQFGTREAALVECIETLFALIGGLLLGLAADVCSPWIIFSFCLFLLAASLLVFHPLAQLGLGPDIAIVAIVSALIGAVDNLASGFTGAFLVDWNEKQRGSSASIANVVSLLSASGTVGTIIHSRLLNLLVPRGNSWGLIFTIAALQALISALLIFPLAFADFKANYQQQLLLSSRPLSSSSSSQPVHLPPALKNNKKVQ
mmetsp:Transcript_7576/g.10521  ORF Transcript_7576/g.10521 Transcript_7576/m.10521 type:complete len:655 (-) Transcript_7576:128-2092(-)